MLQKLRTSWRKWREDSRQYKIDRALYKSGGGGSQTPSVALQEDLGHSARLVEHEHTHAPPPEQRSD
jgi:hypothetical protein